MSMAGSFIPLRNSTSFKKKVIELFLFNLIPIAEIFAP